MVLVAKVYYFYPPTAQTPVPKRIDIYCTSMRFRERLAWRTARSADGVSPGGSLAARARYVALVVVTGVLVVVTVLRPVGFKNED